jgi:hypothetical protein
MPLITAVLNQTVSRQSWSFCVCYDLGFLCHAYIYLALFCREELFYQLGLRQFGDFSRLKLDPPPPLKKLIEIAVEAEAISQETELTKPQIVDVGVSDSSPDLDSNFLNLKRIVNILQTRRDMLSEYFSLNISPDGLVQSLPLLLRDYTPNLDKLPHFLMRLGPQVSASNSVYASELLTTDMPLGQLEF